MNNKLTNYSSILLFYSSQNIRINPRIFEMPQTVAQKMNENFLSIVRLRR